MTRTLPWYRRARPRIVSVQYEDGRTDGVVNAAGGLIECRACDTPTEGDPTTACPCCGAVTVTVEEPGPMRAKT